MKKKIITLTASIFLFCLIVFVSTESVQAAKPQASIKKKKYSTLQKALSKVKKGQTIKILKNIKINKPVTAKRKVKYSINLNKKKITYRGKSNGLVLKNGDVTIYKGTVDDVLVSSKTTVTLKKIKMTKLKNKGGTIFVKNGSIESVDNHIGKCTIDTGTIDSVTNGIHYKKNHRGELVINNGTIDSVYQNAGSCVINQGTYEYFSGRYADEKSTTLIKDGNYYSITLGGKSVVENAICKELDNYGTSEIKNGTFGGVKTSAGKTSGKKEANNYLFQNYGTLVVQNGTYVYDYASMVIGNNKKMTINGGNFEVGFNISLKGSVIINGGTFTNGDGWMFTNHGNLEINNGTFKETSTEHELIYNRAKLIIRGGTLEATNNVLESFGYQKADNSVDISGGTFKSEQGLILELVRLAYPDKVCEPKVTVSGGTFYKNADGLWYNNGEVVPTITGGTFI